MLPARYYLGQVALAVYWTAITVFNVYGYAGEGLLFWGFVLMMVFWSGWACLMTVKAMRARRYHRRLDVAENIFFKRTLEEGLHYKIFK